MKRFCCEAFFLCCSSCVQSVILWLLGKYLLVSELNNAHIIRRVFFQLQFFSHRPNWNSLSVCPQSFSDFNLIWCVGRPWPDMCISVTCTRSNVIDLLKFQKLHFSRSISILAWSSKLMVDYDNMGPSLQHIGARFLNFLLSKLSHDFKLRGMSILQDFQRVIFPYCLRIESHGQVCW